MCLGTSVLPAWLFRYGFGVHRHGSFAFIVSCMHPRGRPPPRIHLKNANSFLSYSWHHRSLSTSTDKRASKVSSREHQSSKLDNAVDFSWQNISWARALGLGTVFAMAKSAGGETLGVRGVITGVWLTFEGGGKIHASQTLAKHACINSMSCM